LPVNRVSAVPRTLQSGHASPMRVACGLPRSAWAKGGGAARPSRASAGTILAPPLHGFFNGEGPALIPRPHRRLTRVSDPRVHADRFGPCGLPRRARPEGLAPWLVQGF